MGEQLAEKLFEYGVLGLVCVVMGYVLYKFWQKEQKEKQHLIERLEKLNDEIRKGNLHQ